VKDVWNRCLPVFARAVCAWVLLIPPAQAADAPPESPFELQVDAPEPLGAFLARHVDLKRFQAFPDLNRSELERLVAQAPRNVRDLLGTQGYFGPEVAVTLVARDPLPPLVQVRVTPGEPARVALAQITLEGDARDHAEAAPQRERLNREWGLPPGEVFTQSAWDTAKSRALRQLKEKRYPRAELVNSLADIVPERNEANLYVVLDSGEPHAFGDIQVEGAQRYDPEMARRLVRLAGVRPGTPYEEALLQDAQRRLTESGYYPSAFVLPAPEGEPGHHTVIARVRETPLQQVVVGVGASTDRGARLSIEHTHHRVPGLGWRAVSQLQLERDTTTLGVDLTAPVDDKGWQWITSGQAQRQEDGTRITQTRQLRLGQAQDDPVLDRRYFLQLDRSVSRDAFVPGGTDVATSVSANYAWTRRAFDDLTAPRTGHGLAVELGAGVTLTQERRPYVRTRVRWLGYWPVAEASEQPSRLALRLEGGAVWSRQGAPVPVTQRFLAGGDNSVRGYALREIGVPLPGGGVEAGKWLSVASLEWQRPIWRGGQKTAWESTVFIDAGAVANQPGDLKPLVGLGAGVRYNSPVGPLQADLAYGLDSKRFRLHLSVGFTF
jgi:translocation and assembly module TamA